MVRRAGDDAPHASHQDTECARDRRLERPYLLCIEPSPRWRGCDQTSHSVKVQPVHTQSGLSALLQTLHLR
jgi:hypothetical protein